MPVWFAVPFLLRYALKDCAHNFVLHEKLLRGNLFQAHVMFIRGVSKESCELPHKHAKENQNQDIYVPCVCLKKSSIPPLLMCTTMKCEGFKMVNGVPFSMNRLKIHSKLRFRPWFIGVYSKANQGVQSFPSSQLWLCVCRCNFNTFQKDFLKNR